MDRQLIDPEAIPVGVGICGEPDFQLTLEAVESVAVFGMFSQIDRFVRICGEMIKTVRPSAIAGDVFPLPGPDHPGIPIFGKHRMAGDLIRGGQRGGHGHACGLQEFPERIEMGAGGRLHFSGRNAGAPHQEGNPQRGLCEVHRPGTIAFPPDAMMSQTAAMIGGVHHQRILQTSGDLQFVEETTDSAVNLTHTRGISTPAGTSFVFKIMSGRAILVFRPRMSGLAGKLRKVTFRNGGQRGRIMMRFHVG
jgi:hypothetical protein